MNIAAIGSQERLEELNLVLSSAGLSYTRLESTKNIQFQSYDVIFDLNFDDHPGSIVDYHDIPAGTTLFLSCVKIQLEAVVPKKLWELVIGINAMPTFLKRKALEYCSLKTDMDENLIRSMGWQEANRTSSRVGLVSPRVVFMIINEAYYTLQEGTADRKDIDKGMKLGTAYPFGPFEWCDMIGLKDVYETLRAMHEDTGDERYRICSLLKTEHLRASNS